MGDTITHISKVEIKGLWGRYDIEWNLSPETNVLAGINGSGKSTILNAVYALLNREFDIDETAMLFDCIAVYVNEVLLAKYRFAKSIDSSLSKLQNDAINQKFEKIKEDFDSDKIVGKAYKQIYPGRKFTGFITLSSLLYELKDYLQIDFIKTFDVPLKSLEEVRKISSELVKTDLDAQVHNKGRSYLDYQINIGKRAFEILSKSNSDTKAGVAGVRKTYDSFLQMVDDLFLPTGKKVNRDKNELSFLSGDEEISACQLSSGEKQLLLILLTVLVQDIKPSILFMDEPELSLHFDWQKKLIQYIRELNPNVQVILATHSPAIIMEGWVDKVSEVRDLIVLDRKAPTHAS